MKVLNRAGHLWARLKHEEAHLSVKWHEWPGLRVRVRPGSRFAAEARAHLAALVSVRNVEHGVVKR